jgi:hypothetical protein
MPQCLKCGSSRVTKGRVVNYDANTLAVFRPDGLRPLALTLSQGPNLSEEGYACLDCGLVWSSVPPEKLGAYIRKHCAQKANPSEAQPGCSQAMA